ncbi:T-cell activation inhibitor, mitochondrial isoform X1 [Diabrotica virgifera virgifera]|uniref:T-cell activation inhibitor, mitochondrial n=1 Tax=Diabrotica virgifera virgifera TaxID=50390 RepID=A0ABM5I9L5_DIAVI|nr:T-cell activation inhibitor, mitochondrial isoform X1 [Diabrotica virgifera virgifera]
MLRNFSSLLTNRPIILHNRNFTSIEVSTALRPFYFAVHPDLFGKYPSERATNESSLQQLSSILEKIQKSKSVPPVSLSFYVKDKAKKTDKFRFINIDIQGNDIRTTLCTILKSCDLPTDYVDSIIPPPPPSADNNPNSPNFKFRYKNEIDLTKVNQNHPIYAHIKMQMDMKRAQELLRLRNYLKKYAPEALKKSRKGDIHREEVKRLQEIITNELQVEELRWDCSWNEEHRKGCLLSFMSLVNQHASIKDVLRGRVLIFSSFFTGVSLDGHIMLYSGEVRHNWLDFLKNIDRYDAALKRIPAFEKSLSHVLRKIKIGRRKFMPKIVAGQYENNLRQITTSLSDYIGLKPFPVEWPSSLENFEIVVETEAGPLMVSPTGQFIVPATIPGSLLVNFITTNLEEASKKIVDYKSNKYLERALNKKCIEDLQLAVLSKDDNITPDLMIKCCEQLIKNKYELQSYTKDLRLNITTYYSVLSDGVVCIPWNFDL